MLGLTNMEGRRGAANVTTLSKMSLELNWRLDELIPIAVNGKPDCQGSRWLQLPCKEQHTLCYVPALHRAGARLCVLVEGSQAIFFSSTEQHYSSCQWGEIESLALSPLKVLLFWLCLGKDESGFTN